MGIRSFQSYFAEYKEFYEGVLELARMEDALSRPGKEVTLDEAKKYLQIVDDLLFQCPSGTSIEDLIGLVVVGENRKIG